jgi:hypothetical protein
MQNRHLTVKHFSRAPALLPVLTVLPVLLRALWALLLGTLVSAGSVAAQAQSFPPPLNVATLQDRAELLPHSAYLRDPSGQLTAAAVAAPAAAADFVAPGATVPNLGITRDAVWVRLTLTNPSTEPRPVVLHVDAPGTAFLDLYRAPASAAATPEFSTGARRAYETRPIPGRTFALPLAVPPGGATDYYLRLESDLLLRLNMTLWEPTAFRAYLDQEEIAWGIVLGMLLLMSAYNLLLFVALRDSKHLVLTVFGLAVAASSAIAGG